MIWRWQAVRRTIWRRLPARQMASDLALLPMWYAEAGSAVLAPSAYNADFLKTKSELLGMDVALLTEPEVADGKDWKFSPWGGTLLCGSV